jgi:SAM-dependent MidA family methyltransferase
MPSRSEPTPLALLLAERIRSCGPITFSEYMEACLYHPVHGYYTQAEQQPRRDYFTSVDANPLFGRLLTRQFQEMWCALGRPDSFWLVEAGAGTGQLAKQILDFAFRSLPDFYAALHFIAVERSSSRRALQSNALDAHIARGKFASLEGLPDRITCGCIFSNELIDAMPVHRVTGDGNHLRETYVGLGMHGLCDEIRSPSSAALREYFAEQNVHLEEGQQAEVNLSACRWIEEVGKKLERGFVVRPAAHARHFTGLPAPPRHGGFFSRCGRTGLDRPRELYLSGSSWTTEWTHSHWIYIAEQVLARSCASR